MVSFHSGNPVKIPKPSPAQIKQCATDHSLLVSLFTITPVSRCKYGSVVHPGHARLGQQIAHFRPVKSGIQVR